MVVHDKRNKRSFIYLKGISLLICLMLLAGMLSCTSSTGSSSSSGSGTATGWTITVSATPSTASASNGDVLGIVALVKDRNGAPAVRGTNVCVNALRGGFVNAASTDGLVLVAVCSTTSNDIGQVQALYTPSKVVDVEISAGTFQKFNVPINPGPDTITATAMGASGTTTVQVTP